jgi:hypothetical protein
MYNDPIFLEKLNHLSKSKKEDVRSNIDYDDEIEKALDSIRNGKFYSEEEAKIIAKKWGRK